MNISPTLLLGAVQAAFLVLLILGKSRKSFSDQVLATWMATLGAHHLIYALFQHGTLLPSMLVNLNGGVPLLQGPFLYLYVHSLTSGRMRLRRRDLLHLVPFVLFCAHVTWLRFSVESPGPARRSVFDISTLLTTAILVSVPAYAFVSLALLRAHRSRTLARHSEISGRDLSWLRWIALALLTVWIFVFAGFLAGHLAPGSTGVRIRHQMMIAVTMFIYVIGYFGYRQVAVAEPIDADQSAGSPTDSDADKYERSGLRSETIGVLAEDLNRYLDEAKPHLRQGVTLREVAVDLGLSPNHLSQVINQELNRNFHDLINERRVEEFKRRVVDPENARYTLLAIAHDSGFSSKSSFNRVFKKLTGLSPKQFVDQNASRNP